MSQGKNETKTKQKRVKNVKPHLRKQFSSRNKYKMCQLMKNVNCSSDPRRQ